MAKILTGERWDMCGRYPIYESMDHSLFQFRDIRPKAAPEINDLNETSVLLGHSKEGITEHVYRRVGAIAKPSKS
ncbi:MAG TPA: hypothetical protein DD418_14375 [Pseudomonas sp.]|nr:hypothetical protein [Pseudomonas sp.]